MVSEHGRIYWLNRWVTALRTTERPQCRYALAQGEARCAVGILVEEMVADGVIAGTWLSDPLLPPGHSRELYGVQKGIRPTPAYCNDDLGMSFPEIADLIASQIPAHPAPAIEVTRELVPA